MRMSEPSLMRHISCFPSALPSLGVLPFGHHNASWGNGLRERVTVPHEISREERTASGAVRSYPAPPPSARRARRVMRELGFESQITKHNRIQNWCNTACWAGSPLIKLIEAVKPSEQFKHVAFYASAVGK